MRRLLLLGCASLAIGCQPAVELDLDLEGETVVEAGGPLDQLVGSFPAFDSFLAFDIETAAELESNELTRAHVREAYLTFGRLEVMSPAGANFDFLNEINFFVESPGNERARVAGRSLERGVSSVELDLDGIDIASYLQDESFSLVTTANGKNPDDDVTVKAAITLHVVAQP